MRRIPRSRAVVVLGLIVLVAAGPGFAARAAGAAPAGAAVGGTALRGVLYTADGRHGLGGVRVSAVDPESGRRVASAVTRGDGAYAIDGLAAGAYGILIETAGVSFLAEETVELLPGRPTVASFVLQPERAARWSVAGLAGLRGGAARLRGSAGRTPAAAGKSFAGAGFWNSARGLLLIDILATGVVVALAGTGGGNASPSTP